MMRRSSSFAIALSGAIGFAALALASARCRAAAANTGAVRAASPGIAESVPGGPNLLANGNFATGSGRSPDHWRTGGWNESPSVTGYDWLHPSDSQPQLSVNSAQPNDARWLQSLSLGPGWYYVGAEVRAQDVPAGAAGAYVSLDEDGINSPDLHGTTEWQRLGFYLKVGAHGADFDVALRLGGFGSLNTGKAFFRDARVVKVESPLSSGPGFDLAAVRRASVAPPMGKPWTLEATFFLLAIVATAGWYIHRFAAEFASAAPIESPPPSARSIPRSKRRRRTSRRRR